MLTHFAFCMLTHLRFIHLHAHPFAFLPICVVSVQPEEPPEVVGLRIMDPVARPPASTGAHPSPEPPYCVHARTRGAAAGGCIRCFLASLLIYNSELAFPLPPVPFAVFPAC